MIGASEMSFFQVFSKAKVVACCGVNVFSKCLYIKILIP